MSQVGLVYLPLQRGGAQSLEYPGGAFYLSYSLFLFKVIQKNIRNLGKLHQMFSIKDAMLSGCPRSLEAIEFGSS